MKKITSLQYRKTAERRIQLKASTGSHCPTNGFWRPEDGTATEPVFVFEGSMMPRAGAAPPCGTWWTPRRDRRRLPPARHELTGSPTLERQEARPGVPKEPRASWLTVSNAVLAVRRGHNDKYPAIAGDA